MFSMYFNDRLKARFQKHLNGSFPKIWILAFDMFIVAFSFLAVLVIRNYNDLEYVLENDSYCWFVGITSCLYYLAAFLVFGSYKGVLRYSGFYDISLLLKACFSAFAVEAIFKLIVTHVEPHWLNYIAQYRVMIMHFLITTVLITMSRLVVKRFYNEYFFKRTNTVNVIIYGAGKAGIVAVKILNKDMNNRYNIVALIDDDRRKMHKTINGIQVGNPNNVLKKDFLKKKKVDKMIIAIPSLGVNRRQEIINKGLDLGLTVKSVPPLEEWINGQFNTYQINDIKIEDLLEREPIKLDHSGVGNDLKDRRILITGAAGSIGSEICRQVLHYDPQLVIMLDQAESPLFDLQFELKNLPELKNKVNRMTFVIANVKDSVRMEEVFSLYQPDIIYHAAAYKHVPFMEENPYEAISVNVFGTKNVADLAVQYGARKFVMVSTDKAVNPTNVMGCTKRIAEIYTQSHSTERTHFITTRFGNVLGSNGSVIPTFMKQLEKGGPLTVTHKDIIRYFMTIPEACDLVLQASTLGTGGDIFVFDMGKPVKIYDLAKKMILLSHHPEIEIKEIGLRPGEKLFEELLATKKDNIKTSHPKIMRAMARKYHPEDVDFQLNHLHEILPSCDDMKIVAIMKQMVPEFISNNSVFCQLDNSKDIYNTTLQLDKK